MSSSKPQKVVFVETSALIPMLGQESTIQARILQYIKTGKATVCIDTIVLSEFLAGTDKSEDKNEITERLSKQFRINTFDTHTAMVCSEIFRILKSKGQIPKPKSKRQITKADIMIMASAIVSGANEFMFCDGDFKAYQKFLPQDIYKHKTPTFIRAQDLPPQIIQDDLGIK